MIHGFLLSHNYEVVNFRENLATARKSFLELGLELRFFYLISLRLRDFVSAPSAESHVTFIREPIRYKR